MSTWEIVARLVAGIALIAANAIFVLTEFALTRARQLGKDKFSGSAALRKAWEMTEELEIYLTGCQLGISTTSVLLGVIAEPGVTQLIMPLGELVGLEGGTLRVTSVVLSIVVLNLVHKIWGEQAPTYFGVEAPVTAAKLGAPILYAWTKGLYPVVMAGDGIAKWTLRLFGVTVTRSWVDDDDRDEAGPQTSERRSRSSYGELRRVFNQMMIDHRIPPDRREEVIGALEIDLVPVRDVMIPFDQVVTLPVGATLDEVLAIVGASQKTRYPVEDDGNVVGVLYLPALFADHRKLLRGALSLRDVCVPPTWVDHEENVGALIDRLQDRQQEVALVHGDEGELVGMVTITDAFEYIAGDVFDPGDTLTGEAA